MLVIAYKTITDHILKKVRKRAMSESDSKRFTDFILSITEIPVEQARQFSALVTERQYKKGEFFIREGSSPDMLAFVVKGLFRFFYTNQDGAEFTKGFFSERSVLSANDAILEGKSSYYTIESLEHSVVEAVSFSEFQLLMNDHPSWDKFLIALLQKGYLMKVRRERELLLLDAGQRYQSFLEQYPGFEKRVRQHMIASFLGITPESLSRIRKKRSS